MRRFWMVRVDLLIMAALACQLVGCIKPAHAQEGHVHGHGQYHEAYKGWCQPGFPNCDHVHSCCDGRTVEWKDGKSVKVEGHCYPTEYRPNPNGKSDWIARLAPEDVERFKVEWIEVPDARIIREKNPDHSGQTGHICTNWYTAEILCSRPPTGSL
jgi:hypothetical protein